MKVSENCMEQSVLTLILNGMVVIQYKNEGEWRIFGHVY